MRLQQKTKIFFVSRLLTSWKFDFCVWISAKGKKSRKVRTVVTIVFVYKGLSKSVKSLLQCFFTDHLKHKTENKTICRTPLANSNVHISCRAFQLLWSPLEPFRTFWFIWQSIFDHFQILLNYFFTFLHAQCI